MASPLAVLFPRVIALPRSLRQIAEVHPFCNLEDLRMINFGECFSERAKETREASSAHGPY